LPKRSLNWPWSSDPLNWIGPPRSGFGQRNSAIQPPTFDGETPWVDP
jgi:hypothetical protein